MQEPTAAVTYFNVENLFSISMLACSSFVLSVWSCFIDVLAVVSTDACDPPFSEGLLVSLWTFKKVKVCHCCNEQLACTACQRKPIRREVVEKEPDRRTGGKRRLQAKRIAHDFFLFPWTHPFILGAQTEKCDVCSVSPLNSLNPALWLQSKLHKSQTDFSSEICELDPAAVSENKADLGSVLLQP